MWRLHPASGKPLRKGRLVLLRAVVRLAILDTRHIVPGSVMRLARIFSAAVLRSIRAWLPVVAAVACLASPASAQTACFVTNGVAEPRPVFVDVEQGPTSASQIDIVVPVSIGPVYLILSSAQRTGWVVFLEPGAQLAGVMVTGRVPGSTVSGLRDDIPVVTHFGTGGERRRPCNIPSHLDLPFTPVRPAGDALARGRMALDDYRQTIERAFGGNMMLIVRARSPARLSLADPPAPVFNPAVGQDQLSGGLQGVFELSTRGDIRVGYPEDLRNWILRAREMAGQRPGVRSAVDGMVLTGLPFIVQRETILPRSVVAPDRGLAMIFIVPSNVPPPRGEDVGEALVLFMADGGCAGSRARCPRPLLRRLPAAGAGVLSPPLDGRREATDGEGAELLRGTPETVLRLLQR